LPLEIGDVGDGLADDDADDAEAAGALPETGRTGDERSCFQASM